MDPIQSTTPDPIDDIRGCIERTHINDMIVGAHYIQDLNVVLRAYDKGVEDHNEASDEFNDGFKAAQAGEKIEDEPSDTKHDEWRIGYVWGTHCLAEEEENGRKKLEEIEPEEKDVEEEKGNDD